MSLLFNPAMANRKPCRVCRGPLTPAERGKRYGMPCRPCALKILDEYQRAWREGAELRKAEAAQREREHPPVYYRNPGEPSVLARHRTFLRRAERYFGLSGKVRYVVDESVHDIASQPEAGVVLLGPLWLRSTPRLQQSKLTHELLHIATGLTHGKLACQLHFYSSPRRDRLAPAVYRDILAGTQRFESRQFGFEDR